MEGYHEFDSNTHDCRMKELLEERIQAVFQLEKEALSQFLKCTSIVKYPAKRMLVEDGKTCKKLYYIMQGAVRSYYLKDGKEIVIWLALEDDIITAFNSFISQTKSNEYLELIEDSVLTEISHENLNGLISKYHSVCRLYGMLLQEAFMDLSNQYQDIHFSTSLRKYENLLSKHPEIINRIPLGYIASYLGVTQESLSRIRSMR